jgi:hypothetical protein
MIDFKPLNIDDAVWAKPLLWGAKERGAEYSFANALVWGHVFNMECARINDFLLSRSVKEPSTYVYPRGQGDVKEVIDFVVHDATGRGKPLMLRGISVTAKSELERLFPDKFNYTLVRDVSDYIYTVKIFRYWQAVNYRPSVTWCRVSQKPIAGATKLSLPKISGNV